MSAPFRTGERVRVRNAHSPGHIRTPYYIRGKWGVVECLIGEYPNPEELAYARSGLPKKALYRVRFAQHEVWPGYAGPAHDTLEIDIYEHWLEQG